MEKKHKKRICLCIGLFIVCISAGFISINLRSADYGVEYENFNEEHKTDMTKKVIIKRLIWK